MSHPVVDLVVDAAYRPVSNQEYSDSGNGGLLHKRARILGNVLVQRQCFVDRFALIRGDLAKISFGNSVFVGEDVVVRAPMVSRDAASLEPIPVQFGDYISIGKGTMCEAAAAGSCVVIGQGCVIGSRATIGSCVVIKDNTVVPPSAALGSYGIYEGNPVRRVGDLPLDCAMEIIREAVVRKISGHVVVQQ